jgi:hypothetical protein
MVKVLVYILNRYTKTQIPQNKNISILVQITSEFEELDMFFMSLNFKFMWVFNKLYPLNFLQQANILELIMIGTNHFLLTYS